MRGTNLNVKLFLYGISKKRDLESSKFVSVGHFSGLYGCLSPALTPICYLTIPCRTWYHNRLLEKAQRNRDEMSKARYPLYLMGNPQNRVFFTDFCMKLVRSKYPKPNVVTFECDVQMTKFDIKNYLQNIYNIPVAKVNTSIVYVSFKRNHRNQRIKPKEDYKLAYVTLGEGQTFEFPDLFPDTEEKKNEEMADDLKMKEKKLSKQVAARGGVSTWFSI